MALLLTCFCFHAAQSLTGRKGPDRSVQVSSFIRPCAEPEHLRLTISPTWYVSLSFPPFPVRHVLYYCLQHDPVSPDKMMAFCFVIPLNGIPKLSTQLFADMNGRRILFVDRQQHLFHAMLFCNFQAPAQENSVLSWNSPINLPSSTAQ